MGLLSSRREPQSRFSERTSAVNPIIGEDTESTIRVELTWGEIKTRKLRLSLCNPIPITFLSLVVCLFSSLSKKDPPSGRLKFIFEVTSSLNVGPKSKEENNYCRDATSVDKSIARHWASVPSKDYREPRRSFCRKRARTT